MRSYILKVIGITLLAIFAVLAIAYAIFMIFFPKEVATFYDGIGAYDNAVYYAYQNYQRTEDKNDLNTVCRYALKTGDNEKAIKYLDMLVDDDFHEFCAQNETLGEDYYNFIVGRYVTLKYLNGESANGCADLANDYTLVYRSDCALRAMMFSEVEKDDKSALNYLKGVITSRLGSLSGDERLLAQDDLNRINEFLS